MDLTKPQAAPSALGQPMYAIGQSAPQPTMVQTPDVAQPTPQDAYKNAMISQLATIGNQPAQQSPGQIPVTPAGGTGAGGAMNDMAHVIGTVANAYKQKQVAATAAQPNPGWIPTVTPSV